MTAPDAMKPIPDEVYSLAEQEMSRRVAQWMSGQSVEVWFEGVRDPAQELHRDDRDRALVMTEACVPSGCQCACHRFPGVSHLVACCDQPPYRAECNGLCLTGGDLGFPGSGIAYAHPDCELHGQWAAFNVDGSPR